MKYSDTEHVDKLVNEIKDSLNLTCSKNIFDDSVSQLTTVFNAEKDALILHLLELIGVNTSNKKLLSKHGMIKIQPDGTHEFHWKDRMLCSIRLDIASGKRIINLPNWTLANSDFVGKIDTIP